MISDGEFPSGWRDRVNCAMPAVKRSSSLKDKMSMWVEAPVTEQWGLRSIVSF